ncbi:MAG: heme-binding domain-containing protein [Bacteroidota bacterium]
MLSAKKIFLYVLYALVAVFVIIQFIPVERANPPVLGEPVWDSPRTRAYAQRACFDCHSNQTTWPGYSYVAPISWLLTGHVSEGRREMNFSEWRKKYKSEEVVEEIEKGKMPLRSYLWLHPQARLSDKEKKEFIQGLEKTFQLSGNKQ